MLRTLLLFALAALEGGAQLRPLVQTGAAELDVDDPAVWRNTRDPQRSLILGTVKAAAPDGALLVYGLDGSIRQKVAGIDRPNNVDVEYGFRTGGRTVDIAVVTERRKRALRVFEIDGERGEVRPLGTIPVFEGEPAERGAPMGIGLYRSRDGVVFAIVSRKEGPADGYLWQYRLEDDGAGGVRGVKVRAFGKFSGGAGNEIEAVAVDDAAGRVYYSDEKFGYREYFAEPAKGNGEIGVFGTETFTGDREGIAIYTGRPGYIVCTEQLPGQSKYRLYRRAGRHELVSIVEGGADATDGLEAAASSFGARFPRGFAIAMNSAGKNFYLYRWEEFAGAAVKAAPAVSRAR
ncbi:MAG: phytase [Bryobacteraceae bacterium]|nr:phytase [Bryobacteraceae bacterium]